MVHQARTGEVEELLPSTSFPAALELPRYSIMIKICQIITWLNGASLISISSLLLMNIEFETYRL
jgi:hypothetical protein